MTTSKDIGLRSGAKRRWTGNGTQPARHIPWPEIFKHHISVVEGHLKMIDMIRKHTVPHSGNWYTIMPMIERTQEMLRMAKAATRDFVPAIDTRDQVPIGSSSSSMYPGYSPADHEYGQASQEFGEQWSAAKAQGAEFKPSPNGPQYEFNQPRQAKRKASRNAQADASAQNSSTEPKPTSQPADSEPAVSDGVKYHKRQKRAHIKDTMATAAEHGDTIILDNQYFRIDKKPTPVSVRTISPSPLGHKYPKKAKIKHDGTVLGVQEKRVEFEDITDEVDARLKVKDEKRKRKEEKKRKRKLYEGTDLEAVVEVPDPVTNSTKARQVADEIRLESNTGQAGSEDQSAIKGDRKKRQKKHAEDDVQI